MLPLGSLLTDTYVSMRYESNPKHSDPWQRGRRGARCPDNVDAEQAQRLLSASTRVGGKRYAVFEGQAFCAQRHACGVWHGYPVGWVAVPAVIRQRWLRAGCLRRRDIKRNWD